MEALLWDIVILEESAELLKPPVSVKESIRRRRPMSEKEYLERKKRIQEGKKVWEE